MKRVPIYQTVENRGNRDELERSGPVMCTQDTLRSKGIGDFGPWLGSGYYFWDNSIRNAIRWGETQYRGNYLIFQSSYNACSEDLLDLTGNVEQIEMFHEWGMRYMRNFKQHHLSVAAVIEAMKMADLFPYKAVRANGTNKCRPDDAFYFNGRYVLNYPQKVQLCVIDFRGFCTSPYEYHSASATATYGFI